MVEKIKDKEREEEGEEKGKGAISVYIKKVGTLLGLLDLNDSISPALGENLQFCIQFCNPFALSHSPYDDTAIPRFDTAYKLFESGPFSAAFDF